jgi:hypothetical protein
MTPQIDMIKQNKVAV